MHASKNGTTRQTEIPGTWIFTPPTLTNKLPKTGTHKDPDSFPRVGLMIDGQQNPKIAS